MRRFTCPLLAVFVFFLSLFFALSCADNDADDWGPDCDYTVSFESDVKNIVIAKCAMNTCHNGTNPDAPDWTHFSTFQTAARRGTVKAYVVGHLMPPEGVPQLTYEEIKAIACWSNQGANNN
jgi:uncharacterized membrane protein